MMHYMIFNYSEAFYKYFASLSVLDFVELLFGYSRCPVLRFVKGHPFVFEMKVALPKNFAIDKTRHCRC